MNDLITRALLEDAEGAPSPSFGAADVRRRAGRIRRRRAAGVVAGVALAVVAVSVPVGFAVGHRGGASTVPPAGQTTTATQVGPDFRLSAEPDATHVTDQQPTIPWMVGTTIHSPGGRTIEAPANATVFGRIPGGWLINTRSGHLYEAQFGTPLSTPISRTPDTGLAFNVRGQAAWLSTSTAHVQATGRPILTAQMVIDRMHDFDTTVPGRVGTDEAKIVGMTRGGVIVYSLNSSLRTVHEVHADKTLTESTTIKRRGIHAAAATSPTTGNTAARVSSGCWALVGLDGHLGRRECRWALGAFSPDGRYLIGYPDNGRSSGTDLVAILSARTLEPVATFTAPSGERFDVAGAGWAGDTLLAPVSSGDSWTLSYLSRSGWLENQSISGSSILVAGSSYTGR
jgi:hypothetical protein